MIRHKFSLFSSIFLFATLAIGLAAAKADKGDAAKGKEVFESNGCSSCHNVDTDEKKIGPSLKGLFKRKALQSGKPVNDANVLAQINNGSDNGMPAYADQLSAGDKANLLAYLHTL
jgi:mono/diheme cytochrome c family protein